MHHQLLREARVLGWVRSLLQESLSIHWQHEGMMGFIREISGILFTIRSWTLFNFLCNNFIKHSPRQRRRWLVSFTCSS